MLPCASINTTLPWISTYPYPSTVIPYPSTYPTLPTVGKIPLPTLSIYPTYPINSAYTSPPDSPNRVRRTQAYILKPEATSVIWPGNYLELALPSDLQPECTLAIESRTNNVKFLAPTKYHRSVRIPNNTDEPLSLRKNEHFCQVCLTTELSCDSTDSDIQLPKPPSPTTEFHSDTISVDPDKTLLESYQTKFRTLTQAYNDVFDTKIQGYNGSMGPLGATINMGAIQPPSSSVMTEFLNMPAISY